MCWVAPVQVRSLNTAVVSEHLVFLAVMSEPQAQAGDLHLLLLSSSALQQGPPWMSGVHYQQLLPVSFQPVQLAEKYIPKRRVEWFVLWLTFKLLITAPWKHLAPLFNWITFLSGMVTAGRVTQLGERVFLSTVFSFPPRWKWFSAVGQNFLYLPVFSAWLI